MKMHVEQAQSCYKEIADVKRKKHPSFQVGDKVWLLHRNIKTNRPNLAREIGVLCTLARLSNQ